MLTVLRFILSVCQLSSWGPSVVSDSFGKTHTIFIHVKFSVVRANKDIAQNPQGACWDVNAKESTDTLGLTHGSYLKQTNIFFFTKVSNKQSNCH